MGPATKTITLAGRFRMHRAGYIESPTMAYEAWGELNDARDNAILIFGGLSPSAHASSSAEDLSDGWWEDMIGPGLALDSDRFHIICVNSLGSCFGSTGPASVNPETGKVYRLTFPVLTLEDIAEAAYGVVRELGIEQLHTVIGCSMGGMSGLAFCVRHPEAARNLISISSAARAEPFSIAVRSLQREMIRSDPKWLLGNYEPNDPPLVGQRLARKLGMMSYRSPQEWIQRFGRQRTTATEENVNDPFKIAFSVEAYLENHANKFSGGFDPNCYLYQSRASDLFDLAEQGGSLKSSFKNLKLQRALVIGFTSIILFPLHQQQYLA